VRVVFMGSGSFAVRSLLALLDAGHEVVAVVTQPDKEKGRGRTVTAPPVKPEAQARGLPVLQPRRVKEPEAQDALRALAPDVQVVVAYGQILPTSVIEIPRLGTVNVHGSLLPRYRGAAPVQWAIVRGERETGVTTMLIDAGLDTGPTLLARTEPIRDDDTADVLEARLSALGAAVLLETLAGLEAGTLAAVPQDHGRATHAPIIRKEDGVIDWTAPAAEIERRVRGFHPWPGAGTTLAGRGLRVLRARVADGGGDPGSVVAVDREGIHVACGAGTRLVLVDVQPESKRAMTASAFALGARLAPGARLG
jgi:methionyl-tRNA formyltransferase